MLIRAFASRLTSSSSYSAYQLALTVLPSKIIVMLWPLHVWLVMTFHMVEGIESFFSMLAANGITATMPIPSEPVGYLLLPAILVYVSVIAMIACMVSGRAGAVSVVIIEQYIALFATSRILECIQKANEKVLMGAFSVAFLCMPASCVPMHTSFPEGHWWHHFLHIVECAAARLATVWITAVVQESPFASDLCLFYLAWIFLPWDAISPKLHECRSLFSLLCAQQAVRIIPQWLVFVAALSIPPVARNEGLRDTCIYAASMEMTAELSRWISNCGLAEAACAYLSVFTALHAITVLVCLEEDDPRAKPKNIIIANELATLGLPSEDLVAQ